MSVSYKYRVSVPLPDSRTGVTPASRSKPSIVTAHGITGALVGTAAGVAVGAGASALLPGVDVGVLVAMGILFGGFNGGLLGLMRHLNGR